MSLLEFVEQDDEEGEEEEEGEGPGEFAPSPSGAMGIDNFTLPHPHRSVLGGREDIDPVSY